MLRRTALGLIVGGLATVGCRPAPATPTSPPVAPPPAQDDTVAAESPRAATPVRVADDLEPILGPIRRERGVPGLGAAIVDAEGLQAIGVSGLRRADQEGDLQVDDPFHLGSDSKAITAFMIARLVERGDLQWDVTLAEALPDAKAWMDPGFQGVALLQLLRHRAGLPENALLFSPEAAGVGAAPLDQQRLELAKRFLANPPKWTPGAEFHYSNVGYIVAGLMAELATGKPWETLVQQEVFDPLGMTSCGFGPTARGDETDRPWAHAFVDGTYRPTDIDNPSYMGPAGTVHCNLADWGEFARAQFDTSPQALVTAATLEQLHAGVPLDDGRDGGYALGWLTAESERFGGAAITHDGSNTVNYASIFIVPDKQLGVLVASNAGGEQSQKAVVQAMQALLARVFAVPKS